MRREGDVAQPDERMVGRQPLRDEDVEPGTCDPSLRQGLGQRIEIDRSLHARS